MGIFQLRIYACRRAFMMAVAVLLYTGFAGAQVRIELRAKAVSAGRYVRLGEVAEVEAIPGERVRLEGIFLGAAPRRNSSRTLTRNQIKAQVLAHGINEKDLTISGADQVQVLPAPLPELSPQGGAVVTSADSADGNNCSAASPGIQQTGNNKTGPAFRQELERVVLDLARQELRQNLGIANAQVEVKLLRLSGLESGMEAAAAVKIERSPRRSNSGTFTINFGLYDGNYQRLGGFDASLRAEIRMPTVIACRPLARGEIISSTDVELRMVPLNEGRNAYTTLAEVIGKRAKTSLPAGHVIRTGKVEIQPVVQRGQQVSVSAKVGRIHVRQRGVAMRSGAAGDIIPVKNLQSGKSYPAKIYADGRLELVIAHP